MDDINDLFKDEVESKKTVGKAVWGNIDKSAYFHHVVTKSWNGDRIFNREVAEYRHNLLCKLCDGKGVTLMFSVTMPNHTHDILLTPDWSVLAEVIRVLNSHVSPVVKRNYPERFQRGRPVFNRNPDYVALHDPVALLCAGKYVFDNPAYLKEQNQYVPHSCFWMLERGYLVTPYDEKVLQKIFGLSAKALFALYSTNDSKTVRDFAVRHYSDWPEDRIKALFYKGVAPQAGSVPPADA